MINKIHKYMSVKEARKVFKEMLSLCYDEDYPELHQELVSLEKEAKQDKDYETAMRELINIIPVFTEDFPPEIFSQIEKLYGDFLENE